MLHLQITTLGQARTLQDGQPIHWRSDSSRQLLYYLLSHPEGRRRDEIFRDLWQADDTPAQQNRFRVTLHRLRRALGGTNTVVEGGDRLHLGETVLQASDLHALYRALEEAGHAGDDRTRLNAYQRAADLYTGDFLPHLNGDWVVQAREKHRAAYVHACLELSLLHCEQARCPLAVASLARALRADSFLGEYHHQRLMGCLSVVEGPYVAVGHYRRFVRFLRDHLNDVPLPATVELAEHLKRGKSLCPRLPGQAPPCFPSRALLAGA